MHFNPPSGLSRQNDDLAKWSIPIMQINEVQPVSAQLKLSQANIESSVEKETICSFGPRWPQYLQLTRPDSTNIVAVVKFEPGSAATLNPEGLDYGPIPPLRKLSPEQAEILWGRRKTFETASNINEYRLSCGSENVFLDVVYSENGGIQRYKIRTMSFAHFDDHSSNKGFRISNWRYVQ